VGSGKQLIPREEEQAGEKGYGGDGRGEEEIKKGKSEKAKEKEGNREVTGGEGEDAVDRVW